MQVESLFLFSSLNDGEGEEKKDSKGSKREEEEIMTENGKKKKKRKEKWMPGWGRCDFDQSL